MNRSVPWAMFALFPIASAILIASAPEDPKRAPVPLPQTPLVIEYWFLILAAALLVQVVFFVVHAWRNPKVGPGRRILWVVAMLSVSAIAIPLYWWRYSERAT